MGERPGPASLWQRVEAHLDARTDPFCDAALARELQASPELARAARRLLRRIEGLHAPARTRSRWRIPAAAAAAATLALIARAWIAEPPPPHVGDTPVATVHHAEIRREERRAEPPRAEVVHLGTQRHVGWSLNTREPR